MTTTEEKRLFIGGLVKGVTEEELVEKFSRFGQVSKVEVKTRANDADSSKTFAYVNLTAEDKAFKKCLTVYNNSMWKGGQLTVQLAKESFLSKLKKEQAEVQTCQQEDSRPAWVQKSPALETGKMAVPGTPMDDNGWWVMGKYSRVVPVMRLRKPGSRKLITVDPSQTPHCLKKLKSEGVEEEQLSGLTWQLEESSSHINKLRQGHFPPRYHSTPKETSTLLPESIVSRLQGLAAEEQVSDTEMEIVPVGPMKTTPTPHARSRYDSDSSMSSADTDEIVCKASGKNSVMTAVNHSSGIKKNKNNVGSYVLRPAQCRDITSESREKKAPVRPDRESLVKGKQLNGEDTNTEGRSKPHFQFVKMPKVSGKAWKKSVTLSQRKSTFVENSNEDMEVDMADNRRNLSKKTPEFRGLGMLSSDSEDIVSSDENRKNQGGSEKNRNNQGGSEKDKKNQGGSEKNRNNQGGSEKNRKNQGGSEKNRNNQGGSVLPIAREHSVSLARPADGGSLRKSSLPVLPQKRKRSAAVSSDDSDLDDNDFEKVGKKLAARAVERAGGRGESMGKGGRRGRTMDEGSQRTDAVVMETLTTSEAHGRLARTRKTTQGEEEHMTSMERSHRAYRKLQQQQKQKESLITKTLREGTGSTHITFSDSEESEGHEEKAAHQKAGKMSLFDEDDSDDDSGSDVDFSIRPQFEGKKGRKLFDLQSRIKDNRFYMDERFQSDSESDNVEPDMQQGSDDDLAKEKEQNLKILEKVLGHQPQQRTRLVYEEMSKKRYNPQSADNPVSKNKAKKRRKPDQTEPVDSPTQNHSEHIVDSEASSSHCEQDVEADGPGSEPTKQDWEYDTVNNTVSHHVQQGTEEDDTDSNADGTESDADGTESDADGTESDADGTESAADGTESDADGDADGTESDADGTDNNTVSHHVQQGTEEGDTDSDADGTESDADGTESDADGTDNNTVAHHNQQGTEEGDTDSNADGTESDADGTESDVDGTKSDADGTESDVDGTESDADGTDNNTDGTESDADGTESDTDGTESDADGTDNNTVAHHIQQGTEEDESVPVSSAPGESLKDLFGGGSSFTFFGAPDSGASEETQAVRAFKSVELEEDDSDDEEEVAVERKSRLQEADSSQLAAQQQPSFLVARDDPRLLAAVKFFRRPSPEEFEELCQRWPEERQKVMQVVRERHKKACRKQRQLKRGVKSRTLGKTFAKVKK